MNMKFHAINSCNEIHEKNTTKIFEKIKIKN